MQWKNRNSWQCKLAKTKSHQNFECSRYCNILMLQPSCDNWRSLTVYTYYNALCLCKLEITDDMVDLTRIEPVLANFCPAIHSSKLIKARRSNIKYPKKQSQSPTRKLAD
ncbi:hypothetical protein HAX54_013099 [Datura stramonium]|uniref:Uncharacterized protein n=1 Tax=Datura stramonium TaxID=4076 RepID=A0ABS8RY71_DATST|nr:hypothetical protein [Datura stramonium]